MLYHQTGHHRYTGSKLILHSVIKVYTELSWFMASIWTKDESLSVEYASYLHVKEVEFWDDTDKVSWYISTLRSLLVIYLRFEGSLINYGMTLLKSLWIQWQLWVTQFIKPNHWYDKWTLNFSVLDILLSRRSWIPNWRFGGWRISSILLDGNSLRQPSAY